MILIDEMKNLKIYKTQTFLPTIESDKKKGSAALLLTPNYASSKRLMNNPLFVNKMRFSSYFIEKDVSYYISGKNIKEVEESATGFIHESNDKSYISTDKKEVEKIYGYYNDEGLYNSLVKVKSIDKPLRGRSEMIIFSSDKKKIFVNFKKDGTYTLPGGGWDEGEDPMFAAIREAREETRIIVKDVQYGGNYINLFKKYPDWMIEKKVDIDKRWIGKFSEVYVGTYEKPYTGEIDDIDQDDIIDKGKFYNWDSIIDKLNPVHQQAIRLYLGIISITQESTLTTEERNKLKDSQFGIPSKRKYPLDTHDRVLSAIKFFNYVDEEDEEELAKNLNKAIDKFCDSGERPIVGKNNRFLKYYVNPVNESAMFDNLSWYHLEPVRKGFNPQIAGGWDEELYSKNMEYAIRNDIHFDKEKEDEVQEIDAHVFTAGEDLKSVYMGIISIKSCGNWTKYKWKEKVVSDELLSYLKDEIHDTLLESTKSHTWHNSKGEVVPRICPKCGSKVAVFIKGEPVFLCTNKDCEAYYGDVPFKSSKKESTNYESEDLLNYISESTMFNIGDKVILFNEASASDTQLRNILYKDRMRKREDVILLYDQVKKDSPFIKYTYPEIDKYKGKNLFIDLYYYNKIFFDNNSWVMNRGLNLYLSFMDRLINNPEIKAAGYTKKTIFIPISDWDNTPMVWNFKENINPLSIIYQMMFTGNTRIFDVFGDTDIIFVGKDKYFKINFNEIDAKNLKHDATTFKLFLIKLNKGEEFDPVDMGTDTVESPAVIKANIVDKIEDAKGVDLTKQVAAKSKSTQSSTKKKQESEEAPKEDKVISKATQNQPKSEKVKKAEADKDKLADAINKAADNAASEDDAWEELDTDAIKQILVDLDNDNSVDISAGRSARFSELDAKLLDTEIKGKTVKDILTPKENNAPKPIKLELATPSETWNELSFVNFDKNYDIDKDIISIFRFYEDVSRPIAIRNIEVTDNSTSEDRVELYTVEMEDYRGKRFTIKLDIPIMVDNRFLLRGNYKSIQNQFFNMPIIKTDDDTCQIISNYMKIFVRRFGNSSGKSLPNVARFIKACNKYEGRKIKFTYSDNTKICNKYELPIDYVDLAGTFSKIETSNFILYFNQDEIRSLYQIKDGIGIPFMYDKNKKEIVYFDTYKTSSSFIEAIIALFEEDNSLNEFVESIKSASTPTICSYSRCSIMNSQIPLVVICAYHEGLRKTLEKARIKYEIRSTLSKEIRHDITKDWIKFKDGYVIYDVSYESSLLMNGLKDCSTEEFEIAEIDNRNMYLEFLDNYGGRIKADGMDNFYDLMVDPITKEILEFYKMPTDYISILIYANNLLADNKFMKHTNTASRRIRRYELIAVYTYKVLADAYASYANQLKHSREAAEFMVKQSAVIDKFLTDSITSDDSCINALRDVETTNSITTKGPSGMNSDRAYSLDKRTYDESMLNVLGMSTGFAANVGITRQATIDANIDPNRGFVKSIDGDTSKMEPSKTLTAVEALTPFGTTRDDPFRTAMTFVQTAKHMVRTEDSDPLLVTNGSDEAMPYLTTNKFAFKAKKNGKIEELTEEYILISYNDGTKDYINLKETIEKNSDGGYYVPLKLDLVKGLKIGSKVKENQVVAYDKYSFSNSLGESDNLAYNIGKIAKVAVINTDEGFEDSGVITEELAKKLATRIDLKFDVTLDQATEIVSMMKVGDHVEAGDPLMVWQAPFDDEEANSLLKSLSQDEVSDLGKRKLKSHVTGTVKGIKIFRTIELEDMSESLRKVVDEYEKPLRKLKKKLEENKLDTSQVPAHYSLPPTGKLKKAQNAVVIEYYVEYLDTVGIGDKVVYFSANKAVEKNVIPAGKEPYTDFRPNEHIDAFVSEVSIDKRMVTSTIIYGSLQKLMIELDRSVKDIMNIKYDDSTV